MRRDFVLADNDKLHLDQKVTVVAGVDQTGEPRMLKSQPDGSFSIGGLQLPAHDEAIIANYGATNNLHTVIMKLNDVVVGTVTCLYAGAGAANDDVLTSVKITRP